MAESHGDGRYYFFSKPHGLLKRMTYKKYLQAFVARCIYSKHNAVIIDGFSGKGRYEDENDSEGWKSEIETYGSPLIIIMVVLQFYCNFYDSINGNKRETTWGELHQEALKLLNSDAPGAESPRFGYGPFGDKFETHIYLVELENRNFSEMITNIGKYLDAFFSPLKFLPSSCDDAKCFDISLDFCRISIKAYGKSFEEYQCPRLENARFCTILDPFDFKSLPMAHVRTFLGTNEHEVLVTLMSAAVYNNRGSHFEEVAKLYGIEVSAQRDNKLREFCKHLIANTNGDKSKMPVACAKMYIDHVKNETGARYSTLQEIRTNDTINYHLVFFSNNINSVQPMKETLRACRLLKQGEARLTCPTEEEKDNMTSKNEKDLADIIFKEFNGRTISIKQIRVFVEMTETFVKRNAPLKLMETESNPRLTSIRNIKKCTQTRERIPGTFPKWGIWELKFRTIEAQN